LPILLRPTGDQKLGVDGVKSVAAVDRRQETSE